jgi:hypothetical protein
MNPIPINIAVEDLLSEVVARRLLEMSEVNYVIGDCFSEGGCDYLKRIANGLNNAAKGIPCLMLTDLDRPTRYLCPAALIKNWLTTPRHHNMLIRVPVMEVEAWLLADRIAFAEFLSVRVSDLAEMPDELADPKAEIFRLARRSRRRHIRQGIPPQKYSSARQGPEYNALLCQFVQEQWQPARAKNHSPSLARTIERLKAFYPKWD